MGHLSLPMPSSRKSDWSHGNKTQSFPLPSLPKPPSHHAFSSLPSSRLSTVPIFPTKSRGTSRKHESNNVLKCSKPSHGFPSFTENDLHFLLSPPKAWPHLPAYLANFAPTTFSFWEPFAHTFPLFRMISQNFMWLMPSDSVPRSSILFSKIPYLTTPLTRPLSICLVFFLCVCVCVFCIFLLSNSPCIYVLCLCLNFVVVAVFGLTVWIVTENLAHLYILRLLTYLDLCLSSYFMGFPCGSDGKESACNVGDLGSIPGLGRPPGDTATSPSRILAWRIPWRGEPSRLHSIGFQRVGHDWATFASPYFLHKPLLILWG